MNSTRDPGIFGYVPEPSIRVASEADAPAIARLHLTSYRASYRGLLPESFLADFDIRERERRWKDSLRDPTRTTFLAEDVGGSATAIAFAEIGPCREAGAAVGTGELLALHVAEGYWRQGVGSVVHRHAVQALAAQEFESAILWVLRGNVRACAFYERAGWVRRGDEGHWVVRGVDVFAVAYKLILSG